MCNCLGLFLIIARSVLHGSVQHWMLPFFFLICSCTPSPIWMDLHAVTYFLVKVKTPGIPKTAFIQTASLKLQQAVIWPSSATSSKQRSQTQSSARDRGCDEQDASQCRWPEVGHKKPIKMVQALEMRLQQSFYSFLALPKIKRTQWDRV